MKVAVTGATGFVGSHLVRRLVSAGHEVRILRRQTSDTRLIADLPMTHIIGDVRDLQSVERLVEGCEVVFHTAALISFSKKDREQIFAINVGGTQHVLEACWKSGVRRLVFTSSIAAIGRPTHAGEVLDEATPYNWKPHQVSYSESKHQAERLILHAVTQGLDAVIVNPATIAGPGDIHRHFGHYLFEIQRGNLPFLVSGGMCVVDVEDVVEGHIAAAERGKSGERYILGGDNVTFKEIAIEIARLVNAPLPKWTLPTWGIKGLAFFMEAYAHFSGRRPKLTREMAHYAGLCFYFSHEKAKRELKFNPRSYRESLQRTYEWYNQQGML